MRVLFAAGRPDRTVLQISGRFDHRLAWIFDVTLRRLPKDGTLLEVDLTETEALDSSALGMLLLVRNTRQQDASPVVLRCNEAIRPILRRVCFDRLFQLD